MLLHLAVQPRADRTRGGPGVALDREVEIHRLRAPQQVADGPADEERRRQSGQGAQQLLHAGKAADALTQVCGADGHGPKG